MKSRQGMIQVDGIDLLPLKRFRILIPNYYVSQCGKVWSAKVKKWKKWNLTCLLILIYYSTTQRVYKSLRDC